MVAKLDGTNGLLQQYDYQAPSTGFSYTFAAGVNVLVMNPAGTLATGTITMPASPADGMTITFSSTQTITALTVNANTGQSITNQPSSFGAGSSATFVYRLSNTTWYPNSSNTNGTLTNATLVTPNINSAQVATVTGTAPIYMCRAWVNFNGTGTVAIRGSGNVTSITDSGVGLYDVNFTTAMPDANYAPVVTAYSTNSALYAIGGQVNGQAPTTAKFRIAIGAGASFGADTTAGYADLPHVFASVFR
jgi:hypothetical protein